MENSRTQYALITGGTSGIGKELAKLFAQDGHNLIIVARDEMELNSTKQEISQRFGVQVEAISKDLFEPNAAEELYDEIKENGWSVNVLVNDAGQGQHGKFIEYDIQRDVDIIQLNIVSLTILTKLYLKEMVARNEGKILQLSSLASQTPGPLLAVYSATKAYVQSFTQAIINETEDIEGVTITALLPGATDTDFFNKADAENTKQVQDMKLDDPAIVAKDGYEALMAGKAKMVSGFKNKMQAAMSNIMPEAAGAGNMRKTMEESTSGEYKKSNNS